jgi:AraC-like DNA-binding protein
MDLISLFNFLLLAGAIQGFLFTIATFLARRKIERAVVLLNLFVLSLSLNNLQSWMIDMQFVGDHLYLRHLVIPWYVLILPLYHAFLVDYLELQSREKTFLKLALAIFIAELGVRFLVLSRVDAGTWTPLAISRYNTAEDALTLLFSVFLFLKVVRLAYGERVASEKDNRFRLRWIRWSIWLGGVVMLLWLFAITLNVLTDAMGPPYNYYPLRLGTSILIYWMGYQAFFQYVLLQDRLALRRRIGDRSPVLIPDPVKDSAREEHSRDAFARLDTYVKEQQRFLDPVLSQDQLAEELQMGVSTLSRLVNGFSGHNFSDYINSYRVNYAKALLSHPDFTPYTVAAIGLESGFNSKSAFYDAFKKLAGNTPSQYRSGDRAPTD